MSKKILVVGDNKVNRILLTDVLKIKGYEVLEAENGSIGLKIAEEQEPDLIITDIQMPVMDGKTFIKNLRIIPKLKHITIFAITSCAMKGYREKYLEIGANEYTTKPINLKELVKLVEKYVNILKKIYHNKKNC